MQCRVVYVVVDKPSRFEGEKVMLDIRYEYRGGKGEELRGGSDGGPRA